MIHVINDERGYIGAVTDGHQELAHMDYNDHTEAIQGHYKDWLEETGGENRDNFVKYLEKFCYRELMEAVHVIFLEE
jgi:hypothetical protein